MPRSAMAGLDQLLQLFNTLPAATEQQLASELPEIGSDVLAVEQRDAPRRTGVLMRDLQVQVLNGGVTIRVGLVGSTSGRTGKTTYGAFYGRFVEFGRAGQVVSVERRRRVGGQLRTKNRRKRAEDIITRYSYELPATAPHPYVNTPEAEAVAFTAADRLAQFWDGVFAGNGGS